MPGASALRRVVVLVLMLLLVLGSGWYFIGEKFRASQTEPPDSLTKSDWQRFHARSGSIRARAGSRRLSRLYRGVVHHLQIQRSLCARDRFRARSLSSAPAW